MAWSGVLRREDIGPGIWRLHLDRGAPLVLRGAIPAELAGRRVVVEGEREEGFGLEMAGEAIRVRAVRAA